MRLLVGVDEEEGVACVDEAGAGGAGGHAGALTVFGDQEAVRHPGTTGARDPTRTSLTGVSSIACGTCNPPTTPDAIRAHPGVQQEVEEQMIRFFLMEAANPESVPAEYDHKSRILYLA